MHTNAIERFDRGTKGRKKGQDINFDKFGEDVLLMEQRVKSDKKKTAFSRSEKVI